MIIISFRMLKDNFFQVTGNHIVTLAEELNLDAKQIIAELSTISDLNTFISVVNEKFKNHLKLIL